MLLNSSNNLVLSSQFYFQLIFRDRPQAFTDSSGDLVVAPLYPIPIHFRDPSISNGKTDFGPAATQSAV
jgi:hypothetical protein